MQEIAANNISRRVQAAAVSQLNYRCIRIRVRVWRVRIGGIDADIVTRESLDQVTLRCDGPFFEVRRQPVGVRENKICSCGFAVLRGPLRCTDESGNHSGESGRRVTGVFFPSILAGDWALQDQVCGSAHNHYARTKQTKRVLFMQTPGQQYRRGNLVELLARPISGPVDPTVLRKTSIRSLNGSQPNQCAQWCTHLSCGKKRCCALHEVTSPDEMIAPQIVVALGFAPRDTHRRNNRALKHLVFMCSQHTTAQSIHSAAVGCVGAKVEFWIHNRSLPLPDIRLTM